MPNSRPVHLVNSLHSATGGSEWHTLSLFELLADLTEVHLWTEQRPDPVLAGRFPIRGIDPSRGQIPKGGNLVFIGTYFQIGSWVRNAHPDRTIVFFNTPDYDRLEPLVHSLQAAGLPNVEVAYQAQEYRARFPLFPGPVHPSPIDLRRFVPEAKLHDGFTVGRYSRDHPTKHHPEDAALYVRLSDAGMHVRLMGAMSQRDAISDPRIELLPEGLLPPEEFLKDLDCFYYRVHPSIFEGFGRVIAESMACGVPVVAEDRGGYTDLIQSGKNGFLFRDSEEAFDQLMQLRDDAELRIQMASAARAKIEQTYSQANMAKVAEFYMA